MMISTKHGHHLPASLFEVFRGEQSDMAAELNRARSRSQNVRLLRGTHMSTVDGLFNETSAALQFPYYFGSNWPAFYECISDLEWLDSTAAIRLYVTDAHRILVDEPMAEFDIFIDALVSMRNSHNEAIQMGESWDRPSVKVECVIQVDDASYPAFWQRWGSYLP